MNHLSLSLSLSLSLYIYIYIYIVDVKTFTATWQPSSGLRWKLFRMVRLANRAPWKDLQSKGA